MKSRSHVLAAFILVLLLTLLFVSCGQFPGPALRAEPYGDPLGPKFEGAHAASPATVPDRLTVVTYNIAYGKALVEAIEALQTLEPLQQADIILLQEMEETGVEQMARALGYNYVYYPASRTRHGRNFGNAILSRWPLTDPRKVILPGRHPVTGHQRITVRATAQVGDSDITVYSAHTETPTTQASYRQAQVQTIVDDIGPGNSSIVVGGDFNTASERSIQGMDDQFAAIGLTRATGGVGPTHTKFGVQTVTLDHIFVRGLAPIAAGRLEAEASDHFPVWVQLAIDTILP